jgi:hypothetical protein
VAASKKEALERCFLMTDNSDLDPFDYPKDGHKWGHWAFDAKSRSLTITTVNQFNVAIPQYTIPLDSMNDSASVLDWIAQLNEKTWVSPEDIGNLVKAIDDIFGLHSFCGMGKNRNVDAKGFLKTRYGSDKT